MKNSLGMYVQEQGIDIKAYQSVLGNKNSISYSLSYPITIDKTSNKFLIGLSKMLGKTPFTIYKEIKELEKRTNYAESLNKK